MGLATRSSRFFAQILDGLVAAIPFFGALISMALNEWLGGIAMAGAFIFAVGYYLLADALPGGQSIGKRAFNIAVLDAKTRQPCSPGKSVLRNLLLAMLGPIDWIFIFGSNRQRLGDILADTIVVVRAEGFAAEAY